MSWAWSSDSNKFYEKWQMGWHKWSGVKKLLRHFLLVSGYWNVLHLEVWYTRQFWWKFINFTSIYWGKKLIWKKIRSLALKKYWQGRYSRCKKAEKYHQILILFTFYTTLTKYSDLNWHNLIPNWFWSTIRWLTFLTFRFLSLSLSIFIWSSTCLSK